MKHFFGSWWFTSFYRLHPAHVLPLRPGCSVHVWGQLGHSTVWWAGDNWAHLHFHHIQVKAWRTFPVLPFGIPHSFTTYWRIHLKFRQNGIFSDNFALLADQFQKENPQTSLLAGRLMEDFKCAHEKRQKQLCKEQKMEWNCFHANMWGCWMKRTCHILPLLLN